MLICLLGSLKLVYGLNNSFALGLNNSFALNFLSSRECTHLRSFSQSVAASGTSLQRQQPQLQARMSLGYLLIAVLRFQQKAVVARPGAGAAALNW